MLNNDVQYKRFTWQLDNIININKIHKKVIFLCIGTTLVSGDSFGPMVGSILKKNIKNNMVIIGDRIDTLTYDKIKEKINFINAKYKNKIVIALDSALSSKENIGKIFVQSRGLKYAESLKKDNDIIGDISIKAIVGENKNNNIENFKTLNNVPIENVEIMSKIVSEGIVNVMNKKENYGKNIYK